MNDPNDRTEKRDADAAARTAPRPSPQTDPTNPNNQEAAGYMVAAEQANERRVDEPGLTDANRDRRRSTY
jgi:hypothetical protein